LGLHSMYAAEYGSWDCWMLSALWCQQSYLTAWSKTAHNNWWSMDLQGMHCEEREGPYKMCCLRCWQRGLFVSFVCFVISLTR
jgi:hypothetical protein